MSSDQGDESCFSGTSVPRDQLPDWEENGGDDIVCETEIYRCLSVPGLPHQILWEMKEEMNGIGV